MEKRLAYLFGKSIRVLLLNFRVFFNYKHTFLIITKFYLKDSLYVKVVKPVLHSKC